MEDLVPLIFFLIIVAVNVLKFFIEKGRPKPSSGKKIPPAKQTPRTPSSMESFFENLAEQMTPKPTELAEWPEDRERPDYTQEMEEFTTAQAKEQEEERVAEIIPFHAPEPKVPEKATPRSQEIRTQTKNRSGIRVKGKKNLKRAMIAHIVFSPPRSLDLSFDNTILK